MGTDSSSDSSSPRGVAQFATTHWSLIAAAGRRSTPEAGRALASLCETYWYPLYAFARRRGCAAEDARDLTQEFFARLLDKQLLDAADRERGRFRSFLLTAFKHFVSNQRARQQTHKRGGDRKQFSLDFDAGERRYQFEPVDGWTPERIYERRWALTLLDRVTWQLEQECADKGRGEFYQLCKGCLAGAALDYCEIARQLETTQGAVRVAAHRLRQRYRELLTDEITHTLDDPTQVENELQYLRSALRGETAR